MPFYHVLTNPLASTALDADPDVDAVEDDGSGTAAQKLRRARRRKIRRRVMSWLAAQAMDWQSFYVQSNDNLLFLIETEQPVPDLPPAMEGLFAIKNVDLPAITAYKAANAANWP